jgi:hypothetical protein
MGSCVASAHRSMMSIGRSRASSSPRFASDRARGTLDLSVARVHAQVVKGHPTQSAGGYHKLLHFAMRMATSP